ncbi:MAG TPA: alpha/beta hydrolase [Oxalicibacterium sp.]
MNHDVVHAGADGSAIDLVALHGIQGTRASWQKALPLLADIHWVLPNLRGRAEAWRGTGVQDYTLEKFAEDACAVIADHVHAPRFVLAGWSMGTSVALASFDALRRTGRPLPSALILMSGSPVLKDVQWFGRGNGDDSDAALLQEIATREQRLGMREPADRNAVAWTWQAIRDTDQRALLTSIDVPVLIVHGSDDEDSPVEHAQLLADGLPDAQLMRIAGGRHAILTEQADQVAAAIRTFLSHLSLATSTHRSTS